MVVDATGISVTTGLGIVAIGAAAFAILARRLGQPTVVGFLVTGILIGPVLGLVRVGPVLDALGEFGVALLLFLVGLDLSLGEVRAVGPPALVAGIGQLAGSALGGFFLARFLGFDTGTALFLAAALAFSSTVVVVKILVDLGELSSTHGRLAVGIFLVQDLFVILLLTLLPVIGEAGSLGSGAIAGEVTLAVARTVALVALALLAARFVLPPVFRYASHHGGLLLLFALAWLFVLVAASTRLGVSLEVAAFAGGLGLSMMPYAHDLRRRVHPLLDLFLALFFVSLGVRFALGDALELLPGALAFSAFVIIGNGVVLTLVLGLMRYSLEASFRTGVTVGQVSEFSIVLGALALAQGLISGRTQDFVVLVAMITIAVSSILIWNSARIHRVLSRLRWFNALPSGDRDVKAPPGPPRGHVLVIGWDTIGKALVDVLREKGEDVVVLDAHVQVPEELPPGVKGVYADPVNRPALEAAGFADAKLVFANLPEPGLVRVLMQYAEDGPPIVARAETAAIAEQLERAGAHAIIAPPLLVADEVLDRLERPGGAVAG